MIPVKIECGCGQHYAFDVEPVDGRMASSVACPACGTDGTAAANEIIAQSLPPPIAPPPASARLRVTLPDQAPAPTASAQALHHGAPHASQLGLVGREQAEIEARAKISWGDAPEDVIKFLMLQGFQYPEASDLVQVIYKERMATIRVNGIKKIVMGVGLMFVPVLAYGFFLHIGIIPIKLMGIAAMVGLWGVWQVIKGIFMITVPKMESGDVAEQ